jgi:hypothetical protein
VFTGGDGEGDAKARAAAKVGRVSGRKNETTVLSSMPAPQRRFIVKRCLQGVTEDVNQLRSRNTAREAPESFCINHVRQQRVEKEPNNQRRRASPPLYLGRER